ncbi:hypothetical protein FB451DRAFT_1195726 [Mycena latifolia]|nr:hypothetical protein FB451DRAFT_1195726 [Mycena latifolia]
MARRKTHSQKASRNIGTGSVPLPVIDKVFQGETGLNSSSECSGWSGDGRISQDPILDEGKPSGPIFPVKVEEDVVEAAPRRGTPRARNEEDGADIVEGGMEVKKDEILVCGLIDFDIHGVEPLHRIPNGPDVDRDLLRRVVHNSVQLTVSNHAVGHIPFLKMSLERLPSCSSRSLVLHQVLIVLMDLRVEVGDDHPVKRDLIRLSLIRASPIHNPESIKTKKEDAEAFGEFSPVGVINRNHGRENTSKSRGDSRR